ncbi:alkaline phosphatase family protein [Pseudomonas sp. NUPR-001]|uniref:alkaline phosphatase family protein n=1 Tax=Pseudomonas sp. NUPR-001 TaxID=3416058 RepID=UPI003F9D8507
MSKLKGVSVLAALAALAVIAIFQFKPDSTVQARSPKTLLIGMDGVQLQRYEQLGSNLNLQRLHYNKAYAGGVTGSSSRQSTISGPGWTTLLSGVWANKHDVISNQTNLRVNPEFPSLFRRVRDASPSAYIASIVHWAPINTAFLLEDVKSNDLVETQASDARVIARTLEVLSQTRADFTFIQLDEPDQAGHDACFGAGYNNALRVADNQLGQLLDAVEARARENPDEDWLVLVTTDHGRDTQGCGHGGDSEQEKTAFIASNKPLNAELTSPSPPAENPGPNDLYGFTNQAAVAPTVLRHMGITLPTSWRLDGTPLLGETGVRKARADQATARLLWNSQESGEVVIEKNGQRVAQVKADVQQWVDPQGMNDKADYTLTLNGTPAAVRIAGQARPHLVGAGLPRDGCISSTHQAAPDSSPACQW